jgi:hypothetical protein
VFTAAASWQYDRGEMTNSWKGLSHDEQLQRLAEIISTKLASPATKNMAARVATVSRRGNGRTSGVPPPQP